MADKKYKIKVEGQEIDIPAEVGILEDPDLKRALTPMFPGAANSRIERAEKEDVVTITVIKMAGSKGGGRRSSNSKRGGRPGRPPRCMPSGITPLDFLFLCTYHLNNLGLCCWQKQNEPR